MERLWQLSEVNKNTEEMYIYFMFYFDLVNQFPIVVIIALVTVHYNSKQMFIFGIILPRKLFMKLLESLNEQHVSNKFKIKVHLFPYSTT